MPYIGHLAAIAGVILLACMSPGPNFLVVTSHALASRRTGLCAALGVGAAAFTWALLGVAGLAVVLSRVVWLYEAVRIIGAAYLVWLGLRMLWRLRQPFGAVPAASPAHASTGWVAWRRGYLTSTTNPKAAAFAGSFYVAALPVGAPTWVYVVTAAIVVAVSGGWHLALAILFSTEHVRTLYLRGRRAVDAVMGAVLVALGIRLAITP
jgi:threonine/homoserine/homoserine lactone efflux protein